MSETSSTAAPTAYHAQAKFDLCAATRTTNLEVRSCIGAVPILYVQVGTFPAQHPHSRYTQGPIVEGSLERRLDFSFLIILIPNQTPKFAILTVNIALDCYLPWHGSVLR